jgi:hypothetical protein
MSEIEPIINAIEIKKRGRPTKYNSIEERKQQKKVYNTKFYFKKQDLIIKLNKLMADNDTISKNDINELIQTL